MTFEGDDAMDDLELLIDLHIDGARQGPGSDAATRRAMDLAGLDASRHLAIADLGCGTGASTLVLARDLDADITAVDLLPAFLERLEAQARRVDVADRITTRAASIDALDLAERSLDVIWSEGSIYTIGFAHGVRAWRRFLRPGGVLVASELTWLTHDRPAELHDHWVGAYAEVATASAKVAVLEAAGYRPIGYFPLPEDCWMANYYGPMQDRFDAFLARHDHSAAATAVVESERREIDLYQRYAAYVSYGVYVAQVPS